jgi:iron complex outermembrane receptor protein
MRVRMCASLAGASLLAAAGMAVAQTQVAANATTAAEDDSGLALQEIIVTARRKEESLEDVPQTVNALSADTVQKLNILRFEDITQVVPGLTLSAGTAGYDTAASIRGVTFDRSAQSNPTVALYINDAPVEAGILFQSLFDMGQIEVLRGPQGTLHGESAPSGAITLTTRKPDLDSFGATADVTGQSSNRFSGPFQYNTQAALNIPLVHDMLAVRLAGVYDDNDGDDTHSLHNPAAPFSRTKAGRATVTFQPIDPLSVTASYQHLERSVRDFSPVIGPGAPGGDVPGTNTPAPPAGFNGPPIGGDARLSVMDGARMFTQKVDVVTGQADWHFAGQRLAYVGSYSTITIDAANGQDTGNLLPGSEIYQTNHTPHRHETHELRLMSEERVLGWFDYTAGFFYSKVSNHANVEQPASFLSGSFGSPFAAPSPYTYDPKYTLPVKIDAPGTDSERSVFASGTVHLGDRTELTAGARWIDYQNNDVTTLSLGPAYIALPSQALGLPAGVPCSVAGFGSTYPGTCDLSTTLLPAGAGGPGVIQSLSNHATHKPVIYSVSVSHHFTDGLMAYANTGTAWRPGPAVVGVTNGLNDPTLNSLIYLRPEYSHSYEIGVKDIFLDRRAFVNLAVYHQIYGGLIFLQPAAPYLVYNTNNPNDPNAPPFISQNGFVVNAKSIVNGLDLDGSFRVTPHWTVTGAFSYADGHMQNAPVPCTPPGFDGASVASFKAAVAAAGKPGALVYLCGSNESVSRAPSWNTSLQSEYVVPLAGKLDGYVRGLVNYYPSNPNASPGYDVSSYALVNLYLGVRSADDAWEVTVFAKNLTNRFVTLSKDAAPIAELGGLNNTFGTTGYYNTSFTPPLQVGINLRYAFGSH